MIWYMILFSGFWFMLMAFWDVGPLYFRDWVDTTVMVQHLFGEDGTSNKIWIFLLGMTRDGKSILPEGLININAMLIMLSCFIVAGWSALMRATNSMALGTFLAAAALLLLGGFNYVWIMVLAIVCFSLGEMLSSPKCLEYLYGKFGSKDTISRHAMLDNGMIQADIGAVPIGEAFQKLIEVTGQTGEVLTAQLYATNNIGISWYLMSTVGLVAAAGMYVYGRWTYQLKD